GHGGGGEAVQHGAPARSGRCVQRALARNPAGHAAMAFRAGDRGATFPAAGTACGPGRRRGVDLPAGAEKIFAAADEADSATRPSRGSGRDFGRPVSGRDALTVTNRSDVGRGLSPTSAYCRAFRRRQGYGGRESPTYNARRDRTKLTQNAGVFCWIELGRMNPDYWRR